MDAVFPPSPDERTLDPGIIVKQPRVQRFFVDDRT